jgi:serine/threonine protein kinase
MKTNPVQIIEQAITLDLFGSDALSEAAEVEVPEKYELAGCLGRGGFGVVYKALDKVLDRFVALKFLTNARPADLERFRREARFTARLTNPAIVQIYELGECNDQPYIAMQFIDGRNLADAELQPSAIVQSVAQAARAMQHAHEAGIVHRDFKPANVLIDQQGRAFVTDFGIARDLSPSSAVTLSQEGALMGTPALMAPEQARGDVHAVDARTDVYALGASLYVLLTGRFPFERTGLVDTLHAVIHEEAPLPRAFNSQIPRDIEEVIVKCMQKERSRRYTSMNAVADDLEAYLNGRPVEGSSNAWFRKLVGAKPPSVKSDTDLFEVVGMEAAREIAAWDADMYRVSRNLSRHYPRLDALIERLTRIVQDHPYFAWARFYRGVALFRRERLDEALDEMERSIDRLANRAAAQFEMGKLYLELFLREMQQAYKHLSYTGTEHHMADVKGRLYQAVVAFQEARALETELLPWQIEFVAAVEKLADRQFDACVERCDGILKMDPDVEQVWKLRADALRFAGRHEEAIESYDEAFQIRRSYCEAVMGKADSLFSLDRVEEARGCLENAVAIVPDCVEAYAKLARSHLLEARRDGCEDVARQIERGTHFINEALKRDPDDYDSALTCAEFHLEAARKLGDASRLDAAIDRLDSAVTLKGCINRVHFTKALAMMDRVRHRQAHGGDWSGDMAWILRQENDGAAQTPDGGPWRDLLAEARALANSGGMTG